MSRATYLLLHDFERVEEWCQKVRAVFRGRRHYGIFMVGSVLERADYRDVDLRMIWRDEEFDHEFGDPVKLRYTNRMLSVWGQKETGLPIDFQIQQQTEANTTYPDGKRDPMGIRDWAINTPAGVKVSEHRCRVCNGNAYRPETVTGRRQALRCHGCHQVCGRCTCE